MKRITYILIPLLLAALLGGCAGGSAETATQAPTGAQPQETTSPGEGAPTELTVMVHDSFSASEEVIAQFEQENNAKLVFVQSGDAGSTLNRAILSKDAPIADVLYGVDNTFLSRALEAEIFVPYASPMIESIPDEFKLDTENRVLPVDYGDVCINYDKAYFADNNLPVPQSFDDLTKPEYNGLLVVENPATSSPGLAFLLATIAHYGSDGYLDYWQQLRDNGVVVVNDWETAYYTNFSGSTGQGPQPMAVSYGTSPAVEVIYASTPLDEAPTASIVGEDMCYRQIEFVGILAGTQNQTLAEKFIDYMLGVTFQEDMPDQMFVFPVNPDAQLPEEYQAYIQVPEKPASLPYDEIAANRDQWIQAWTDTVLR